MPVFRFALRASGGLLLALGGAAHATGAAEPPAAVELGPLDVEANAPVPAATQTKTAADLSLVPATEPYDILTGLAGVYMQNDGSPGLAISVRGLQDFGRVNVMIDGARQDFQFSGHGANSSVYIDPALLSGIDVTRGTAGGAGGAGGDRRRG
ncbi:MAG: TonB-dependent receptor plug domain-containing protein [Rhodospirillales bacterium]